MKMPASTTCAAPSAPPRTGNNLFNVICVAFFGVLGLVMENTAIRPRRSSSASSWDDGRAELRYLAYQGTAACCILRAAGFRGPSALTIACLVWPFSSSGAAAGLARAAGSLPPPSSAKLAPAPSSSQLILAAGWAHSCRISAARF